MQIYEETGRLSRLQKDRSELSSRIDLTLVRLYDMCLALKKADSAPVPDKCPSIDKADWLICLLQTKYENVTKCYGLVDKDQHNMNENIKNKVSI